MAEEQKKTYPKIPRANWFAIRDRIKQKTPGEVSASYLASVLGITEVSAANLMPPLKALGLIGDDNKLTDLAFEWRDDASYAEACRKILEKTYPTELLDLYHEPGVALKDVANWFSRRTRWGDAASNKFAAMYLILLEADLTKREVAKPKNTSVLNGKPRAQALPSKPAAAIPRTPKEAKPEERSNGVGFAPKLHVDIQIHISPDSSPEQIDKIFESMAKHLPLKA